MKRAVDYDRLKKQGTGSHGGLGPNKTVECTFGRYRIKVQLTPSNEFLGIEEVAVDKDFISRKRKMIPTGFHDVEEFYPD
jgi:hypothetical protein